jgi:AhpD family alkylhydroperoxidase
MNFRHVTPVRPEEATGQVAAVYDQVNTEFSSIGPAVMMLSPAPELLVPGWALLRESLVAGVVPRWRKEVVTVAVSHANRCAYDLAGHLMFLRLAGGSHVADALERGEDPADEEVAAIARWARSGGSPPASPEYVGTALALHFVNRMVLALLAGDLLPGDMREGSPAAFDGAPIARAIQRERVPGESLRLLTDPPTDGIPTWAGDSPIGPAYAALRAAAIRGGGLLSEAARKVVEDTVTGHLRDGRAWLAESLDPLTPEDRPGATLAILAGLAPSEITDEDVTSWRGTKYTDHCLLHLLAYGAITAVDRVEAEIAY